MIRKIYKIKVILLLLVSPVLIYVILKLRNYFTNHFNTLPYFPDFEFDNIYWQTVNTTSNGPYKLLRAFYDDRIKSTIGPSIRIIAMINRTEIKNTTIFCQIWFNNVMKPIVSDKILYRLIWYREWRWDKSYMPFVITCSYNFNDYQEIPDGVSLTTKNSSEAENYLKILNIRPEKNTGMKKPFAVCVKDFNFDDDNYAIRLTEWIELIRILGADKIFIYEYHATGNIHKVFRYYERSGFLEIIRLSYPKGVSTVRRPNVLISLNDCFYRNIYLYDYIAVIDVDEIIMPRYPEDMSWIDLLERIKHTQLHYNKNYDSYTFRNIYFSSDLQHNNDSHLDIPQYLYFLPHIIRPINHTDREYSIKSFHSTELVESVHNHYPVSCLHHNGWCDNFEVNIKFGHLAHYRQVCPKELGEIICNYFKNHTVVDKTIWKYKDELLQQTMKTIRILKLLKDHK